MNQTAKHARRPRGSVLPGALTKRQLRENIRLALTEAGYSSHSKAVARLREHLGPEFSSAYAKNLLTNILGVRSMPGFDRIDAFAKLMGLDMDTIRGISRTDNKPPP